MKYTLYATGFPLFYGFSLSACAPRFVSSLWRAVLIAMCFLQGIGVWDGGNGVQQAFAAMPGNVKNTMVVEQPSAPPTRVVALAPSVVELIYALDAQDILVGRTEYSNYPPEALTLPSVGSYHRPDIERILALNPDLCIGLSDGTPEILVQKLQKFGVQVLVLDLQSLNDLQAALKNLGSILGKSEGAQKLSDQVGSCVKELRTQTQAYLENHADAPTVLFLVQRYPAIAVGRETFMAELLDTVGLNNIISSSGYPKLSMEELLLLSPNIVMSAATAGENIGMSGVEEVLEIPELHKIFPKGTIFFVVDGDIFHRPSIRSICFLQLLQEKIFAAPAKQSKQ